jgi:large subunit ribosomal protein L15
MATTKNDAEGTEKAAPAEKATAKASKPAAAKTTAAKTTAAKAPATKAAATADATVKASKPAAKASTKAAAEKPAVEKAPAKAAATSAKAEKAAPAKSAAKATAPEGQGGTLRLHHLRPAPGAHTSKTRVGRGEGSKGKTSGRGTKGTKARYQVPASREGGGIPLHMRLPKLRGFKNPFRTEYQVVNLDRLAELYPTGGVVTSEDLVAKGAVRKGEPVKVLASGDISVKLDVAVTAVSAAAKEKILAAGGTIRD